MEQTLLKVIDQSGILALSLVVLYFGGKKIDDLSCEVKLLGKLMAIQLIKDGYDTEVKALIGDKDYATLNGDNTPPRNS
jgi:hypothetical protein